MQVPILSGIYTNGDSDFRVSYPRNLEPVPQDQGISTGYLRPADGIISYGASPGVDRGGINWNGVCYRVMGTKLVKIDEAGVALPLGYVGGQGQVSLDYSMDRLAIVSSGALFYYAGGVITQVTNPNLGYVVDAQWVDGYFLCTDGTHMVVTELNDPMTVMPLKYASSEADPDPIVGLLKLRNEIYAINRYSVEVFQDVGGTGFPFQRIEGAMIQRGSVGTYANAVFIDKIAFVGGGRNEAVSVWLGLNGFSERISTREVDLVLNAYTETQLAGIVCENRVSASQHLLYIHLPDQTLVFNADASKMMQEPVWYTLTSTVTGRGLYRARNFVRCYGKWLVGDPSSTAYGYLSESVSSHYGDVVGWEFGTQIAYNEGRGAIFHELELVTLPGRAVFGDNPTIWTNYSTDGENWSQPKSRVAGKFGENAKRLNWLQQGFMRHWRVQKFWGTSDAHLSFARLEARIEGMNV